MSTPGGKFDFDDGGTYAGGWEDGKANGYGVCTGPKGQGEFAGTWHMGFETSGVYTWSSGNNYKGQWTQGKRHGVGVEVKGRWVYQGEWTQGFKGRYGIRQSTSTGAKYEGTWTTGLQDGYGVETYADGGIYQGQWLRGIRHGYGLRQSVPYGLAARHQQKAGRESLTSLRSEHEDDSVVKDRDRRLDEKRGGFILTAVRAEEVVLPPVTSSSSSPGSNFGRTLLDGLGLRKLGSAGDVQGGGGPWAGARRGRFGRGTRSSVRSAVSSRSDQSHVTVATDNSDASFVIADDVTDVDAIETYAGEWKGDKRSGFGVSERSDGLRYEGEWDANRRHGYGSTTFADGTKEEGKYRNNVLVTCGNKSRMLKLKPTRLQDKVRDAVKTAKGASEIALQKSDIAVSRLTTARLKAELAVAASNKAQSDSEKARVKATEYAPDFMQARAEKIPEEFPVRSPLLSFGEHYDVSASPNPDSRTPLLLQGPHSAISILQRVANIAGIDRGHLEVSGRPPPPPTTPLPPSLASALRSVAVDSAAPLVRRVKKRGGVGGADGGDEPPPGHHVTGNQGLSGRREVGPSVGENVGDNVGRAAPTSDISETSVRLEAVIMDDRLDQYRTWSGQLSTGPGRQSGSRRSGTPFGPRDDAEGSVDARTPSASSTPAQEWGVADGRDLSRQSSRGHDPCVASLPQTDTLDRSRAVPRGLRRGDVGGGAGAPIDARQAVPEPGFLRLPMSGALRGAAGKTGSFEGSSVRGHGFHPMASRRTEEIRRDREAEASSRQDHVVTSFKEFKEWCRGRQLVVLVLAVNISLATMFFSLLDT